MVRTEKVAQEVILYLLIPDSSLCLHPWQILHGLLLRNVLENMYTSQKHVKIIVYGKFGGEGEGEI